MKIHEKLQMLRRKNGYSQEQLADRLGVARQTVGNWESGQVMPELDNLIALSDLYRVAIDRIVREEDDCNISLREIGICDISVLTRFILEANSRTYAGHGPEVSSCRMASHDLQYENGEYLYYDTYLGGECFSGEEGIWRQQIPVWSMNYSGRVTGKHFSGDFLKEALCEMPEDKPYRGPAFYQNGEYSYHCKSDGEFVWFQGYEEIFYEKEKIYECYFHGGIVK